MAARHEYLRKAVHICMGFFAFSFAYLSWEQAALLAAASLAHNLFLLPLYGGRQIFRGAAAHRGHDPGIVLYPATVLVIVLIFRDQLEIAAAGWAYLAFGDGFATIFGMAAGRFTGKLPWNRDKSWAGLIGFALMGTPAAGILYGFTAHLGWDLRWVVPVTVVGCILALLETLPLGLDDNLIVPIGGAALLFAALLIEPSLLVARSGEMLERLPWALGVNLLLGFGALRMGSVDWSGLIHGTVLGTALWVFGGLPAFLMLFGFFLLASVATKMGYRIKVAEGTAQEKGGARGAPNAWANTGAGVLFALLAVGAAEPSPYLLAVVAAFATALSDTLGSEIGQAFGRRTFLITSFRPVPRGTDGAVSLEGTLAGIAGSLILAAVAWGVGMISPLGILIVGLAAFAGTTMESYLGALLERAKKINNEAQNFLNTLAGGLVAILLMSCFV